MHRVDFLLLLYAPVNAHDGRHQQRPDWNFWTNYMTLLNLREDQK